VKLTRDVPLDEIYEIIGKANDWVKVVPNEKEATLRDLTPTAVTGTLSVPVGRLRKRSEERRVGKECRSRGGPSQ